jgi:hypothetical protein
MEKKETPKLVQTIISATCGGIITTSIVTPLDVIKTRMVNKYS